MRFEVMHGGFRFELGAEMSKSEIRALAVMGKPNTHQRHVDAWQDLTDACEVINKLIAAGAPLRQLANFHAGNGPIGTVLDSCALKLRGQGGIYAL